MKQLTCLSSMASRQVLLALFERLRAELSIDVTLTAIGGVDAQKRVQAGEVWDMVVLADKAIGTLIEQGHGVAGLAKPLVTSDIYVAEPASGTPALDLSSAQAVKLAVQSASSIGYSTGPSGMYLEKLFASWGMAQTVAAKLVVPPPGTPVAAMISQGKVSLGFQQLSELLNVEGVKVLGPLPADIQLTTTFTGMVGALSKETAAAESVLAFLASAQCDAIKRDNGMQPA